ncbi:MAG: transposase [Planctomycetota bacterium]|nr:transposase [Planctomycetota bacterium]
MAEVRRQVREELGEENTVLVLAASSFPKKGRESCGVQRQWSGRLNKTDNCQVGVFLCYAAAGVSMAAIRGSCRREGAAVGVFCGW